MERENECECDSKRGWATARASIRKKVLEVGQERAQESTRGHSSSEKDR